jgi:hypothetical protein
MKKNNDDFKSKNQLKIILRKTVRFGKPGIK